jgi:enamine deaminase RidA (YjgF/YER057c/UK114 family)
MTKIQRVGVEKRYSQVVIHRDTIYLSGQVPWCTSEQGLAIENQVEECFEQIDSHLKSVGSSRNQILNIQIFLKNPDDYEAMNRIFERWIEADCVPARNTICGVVFPNPKWLCEFVVTAAINTRT